MKENQEKNPDFFRPKIEAIFSEKKFLFKTKTRHLKHCSSNVHREKA
jgi:hypothetical protein